MKVSNSTPVPLASHIMKAEAGVPPSSSQTLIWMTPVLLPASTWCHHLSAPLHIHLPGGDVPGCRQSGGQLSGPFITKWKAIYITTPLSFQISIFCLFQILLHSPTAPPWPLHSRSHSTCVDCFFAILVLHLTLVKSSSMYEYIRLDPEYGFFVVVDIDHLFC